ncbi:MAG: hypothetical protein ACTSUT_05340 [Promethearchaeota archaeon]
MKKKFKSKLIVSRIHITIIYNLGTLNLQLNVAREMFLEKKRELESIKINFKLINGGLSKNNVQKVSIGDLFIRNDILSIPIPLDNLYDFKETYFNLKSIIFNYIDCSINLMIIQQPCPFKELLLKQIKLNLFNIQRKIVIRRKPENIIKILK